MKLPLATLVLVMTLMPLTASAEAPPPSKDDRKIALEEFKAGRKQESLKSWSAAIGHYKNALMLVPKYYWAHKQIGMCHYRSGNYDSAFESYKKYLKANPKDKKTRAFVAKLFKQLKSGELNRRLGPKKTGREMRRTPYLSLGGGMVMTSPDDVEASYGDLWDVTATGAMPYYNIEAGFLFSSGFFLQGSAFRGLKRSVEGKSVLPLPGLEFSEQYSQSALLIMIGWDLRLGKNALIGLQTGAGSTTVSGSGGTSEDSIAWAIEAKADYLLGTQWGLGLRIGWFSSNFEDFQLEHTGLTVRVAVQWYLFPMRELP